MSQKRVEVYFLQNSLFGDVPPSFQSRIDRSVTMGDAKSQLKLEDDSEAIIPTAKVLRNLRNLEANLEHRDPSLPVS
jgi:hypothetical protein